MVKIKSKDYHDYIIKNGKFIGAFEQMYQDIDDPWHHGDASAIQYDIALFLIKRYKICVRGGRILDIGCGKGAFTSRIKKQIPKSRILAVDIAPTAIKKAKEKYGKLGIDFEVMDIRRDYNGLKEKFDLLVLSQLMWYVLPKFRNIIYHLKVKLKRNGYVIVNQTFYKPGVQKYGVKIVSSEEDMLRFFKGYKIIQLIEIGSRLQNHGVVILLKPKW
jgi:2-polyprenyl-3-methyl-5-hydroxy-6-metoxy-1,4-benzoquinol methylase